MMVTASVTISWADNSTNETGFQILRAPDNASAAGTFAPVVDPNNPTGPNVTSFVDTTVVPGNIYWYQVVALGLTGVVPNSTPAQAPAGILNDLPAAPTTLTAAAPAYNMVSLSWVDASNSETGFRIERAPDVPILAGNFSVVAWHCPTCKLLTTTM